MDERWVPLIVLTPIVIVVVGYLFAWRAKNAKLRKSGSLILAVILGLVALFGSWWALGWSIGIWGLDGSGFGPHTAKEVLLALAGEAILLIFPFGAWYLCVRFAKAASKENNPKSRPEA